MSLDTLHAQSQSGDEEAREELFRALTGRFRLLALRKVRNRLDAEEIVQKALVTVLEKYREIEFEKSFTAWAQTVLDYKVLDHYRAKGRQERRSGQIEDISRHPVPWSPNPGLEDQLLECLQKIRKASVRVGRILNLFYQGYRTEEVCRKVECSTNNAYKLLSRARAMLRLCLEKGEVD